MPKISELSAITSVANTDLLMVVHDPSGSPSTNKVTVGNFANSIIKTANSTVAGVIKVGDSLTVNATGFLDVTATVAPTPYIEYTGTFGGLPQFWRYTSSFPKLQYTSNGVFRDSGTGYYWLDSNFDDGDYDLSGLTSIRFTNIGGIKGYLDFSDKTEVVLTTLDLGEIAVVDEWVQIAGFSNTLTTFSANNLIDIGGGLDIYGNIFYNGQQWNFPVLDRVTGTIYIDYNSDNSDYFANTAAPSFPALTYAGSGIYIYYNKYTSWSDFTSLETMNNDFQFRNNSNNDNELYDGPGMPALVSLNNGTLYYYQNEGMQSISEFTNLIRIDGSIQIYDNDQLETFPSFPSITYVAGVYSYNNSIMTTLDGGEGFLPSVLRVDGDVSFRNCNLNSTSIDSILEKLASLDGTANTVTFEYRTVYLDQGTNDVPSANGISAKETLESRNCTIYINT